MTGSLKGLLLAAFLLTGCQALRYEAYPESRATPEEGFETLRMAVLSENPVLLYDCLSPRLLGEFGIPSYQVFNVVYRTHSSEFGRLAWVLERAETSKTVLRTGPGGTRYAAVTVEALGGAATFLFVAKPTVTITVVMPDYPDEPQVAESDEPWRRWVEVTDDERIVIRRPIDAEGTGVSSAKEIEQIRMHYQWFLDDLPGELKDGLIQLDPGTAGSP